MLEGFVSSAPGLQCLGSYSTLETARSGILTRKPSVVLLSLLMPDGCGIAFTRFLKTVLPMIMVVMVSGIDFDDVIADALDAGAYGFLIKPFLPGQLIATLMFAVGRLGRGHSARGVQSDCDGIVAPAALSLSRREQAIMGLLATGLFYKEIAQELHLSVPLVHKIVHVVYSKMHVSTRTEAIRCWSNR